MINLTPYKVEVHNFRDELTELLKSSSLLQFKFPPLFKKKSEILDFQEKLEEAAINLVGIAARLREVKREIDRRKNSGEK